MRIYITWVTVKIGVPGFFDCSGVPGCSGVFRCSSIPMFRGVPVFRCSWFQYMSPGTILCDVTHYAPSISSQVMSCPVGKADNKDKGTPWCFIGASYFHRNVKFLETYALLILYPFLTELHCMKGTCYFLYNELLRSPGSCLPLRFYPIIRNFQHFWRLKNVCKAEVYTNLKLSSDVIDLVQVLIWCRSWSVYVMSDKYHSAFTVHTHWLVMSRARGGTDSL